MIAAVAVGSHAVYIYLRGEYRYLLEIMQKAIADCYARGISARTFLAPATIYTFTGTAAPALTRSAKSLPSWNRWKAERGIPRIKPPFPAVVGLYGGPTVINNAETIATVPHVIAWAAKPTPQLARRATAARASSASAATSSAPASTSCPWATTSKK